MDWPKNMNCELASGLCPKKKMSTHFYIKIVKFSAHKTFVKPKFQKMYSVSSKNHHLKVHVHFIVSAKVSIVSDIIFPAHDH